MEELKTELFDMVNANGEKVRFEIEQKMFQEEFYSSRSDKWFMFGLIVALFVCSFAWWFI